MLSLNSISKSYRFDLSNFTKYLFYFYIISIILIARVNVGNVISKVIAAGIIFSFICFNLIMYREKITLSKESIFFIIWVGFCILSGLNAKDPTLYYDKLFTLIQLFVFYVIGYSIIINKDVKLNDILVLIIFSSFLVFLQGILLSESSSPLSSQTRLQSVQGNPNAISYYGIFSLVFLFYFFKTTRNKWVKLFIIVVSLFFLYGILETQSRKAIIVIPLIFIIYFILNKVREYPKVRSKSFFFIKILVLLVIVFSLLFMALYLLMNTKYFERFEQLAMYFEMQSGGKEQAFKQIMDYSTYERRQFIKHGIRMWLDHPLLGGGLDNFRARINEYWISSRTTYSHNNYVELLSTIGIFGAAAYYLIYYSIFRKLYTKLSLTRIRREKLMLIKIFIIGIAILSILDLANVSYYTKFFWLIILIFNAFTDKIILNGQKVN